MGTEQHRCSETEEAAVWKEFFIRHASKDMEPMTHQVGTSILALVGVSKVQFYESKVYSAASSQTCGCVFPRMLQ